MLLKDIGTGTHVVIHVERDGYDKYCTTIVDSISGNTINVLAPMDGTRVLHLSKAEDINLLLTGSDGVYKWACKLIAESCDKVPTITLESDVDSIRYNRRNAFRISTLQSIKYICNRKTCEGTMLDISLLGVCFCSEEKHNIGDYITVNIPVNDVETVIRAQIIRQPIKIEDSEKYRYGALMVSRENPIVRKYIAELQRKQLSLRNKENT